MTKGIRRDVRLLFRVDPLPLESPRDRASTTEVISDGLMKDIRTLVEPYPWNLIKDHRIIGSVFHIITPSVIEDLGNLLSSAQQLAVYPAPLRSEADRDILRALFMTDWTGRHT